MSDNKTVHTKSRLVLESRHQLIDLNKEYVNCEITFECKAADASKDFEILVINQDQLDNVDLTNLEMKRTRGGFISGVIVADEDRYQNYFLILRSGDGNPVDVDLDLKICPIAPDPAKVAAAQQHQQQQYETTVSPAVAPRQESWIGDGRTSTTYVALAVVVIIAAVIGGVYAYKRYSSGKTDALLEAASAGSETGSSSSDTSSNMSKKDILGILHKKEKK